MGDKDVEKVTPAEFSMALLVTLTLVTLGMQMVTMFTIPGALILFVLGIITFIACMIYVIYRMQ